MVMVLRSKGPSHGDGAAMGDGARGGAGRRDDAAARAARGVSVLDSRAGRSRRIARRGRGGGDGQRVARLGARQRRQ